MLAILQVSQNGPKSLKKKCLKLYHNGAIRARIYEDLKGAKNSVFKASKVFR